MKKRIAAIVMIAACCYFYRMPNGNEYGPFDTFSDCYNWSNRTHVFGGMCIYALP